MDLSVDKNEEHCWNDNWLVGQSTVCQEPVQSISNCLRSVKMVNRNISAGVHFNF
jgi:hypothetical protein